MSQKPTPPDIQKHKPVCLIYQEAQAEQPKKTQAWLDLLESPEDVRVAETVLAESGIWEPWIEKETLPTPEGYSEPQQKIFETICDVLGNGIDKHCEYDQGTELAYQKTRVKAHSEVGKNAEKILVRATRLERMAFIVGRYAAYHVTNTRPST